MIIWMFVAVKLGSVEMTTADRQLEKRDLIRDEVCYGSLGCFFNGQPFRSSARPLSVVPQSPDKIMTKFVLYTRQNRDVPQILDARKIQSAVDVFTHFKVKRTKILIHGFLDNIALTSMWKQMTDELLKHGDYNVVIVDWSGGNLPPYTQATANTRVVGAQVSEVINWYINGTNMTAADFHVIGHSLGAHIAGYAGERVPGLGRITGLDPAGFFFENMDTRVRLDETDADFVDIIHTDAVKSSLFNFGTTTQSGHADFFPNLGRKQPGCRENRMSATTFMKYGVDAEGFFETFMCSHMRAAWFFIVSINSDCPFQAVPCASEEDFVNNLCDTCANKTCSYMGFHANKKPPPGNKQTKYYLTTSDLDPFCGYHYGVTIKFSLGQGLAQEGYIYLDIKGESFKFTKVSLTRDGKPRTFKPGESYRFHIMLPSDVGNIHFVTVSWKPTLTILPFVNISKDQQPTLYVDEIHIYREEAGVDVHFCAHFKSVVSSSPRTISMKC